MLPKRYKALTNSVFPGGFGSVQRVQDTYLNREVLFKSMQDATDRHQLKSEIQGLTRARSRHVVEIYDVVRNEAGEISGVIIEYLTGRSFEGFYKEVAKDVPTYLRLLYQIAVALRDMHAVNIVHRDIKLDNMKNSGSGLLKVFDFGISVAAEDYRTKRNRGTFDYAGPELYVDNASITTALDVYAWGICAWKLATAVLPPALLERPPQEKALAPSIDSALPKMLPAEIVSLIDLSLSVLPSNRPSAKEIAETFAKYLVKGLHRGLFVKDDSVVFELSSKSDVVRVRIPPLGGLIVKYDGLAFVIESVEGSVSINNVDALPGALLPDACCIGFGALPLGSSRKWVTFSSSHPEVIL